MAGRRVARGTKTHYSMNNKIKYWTACVSSIAEMNTWRDAYRAWRAAK